jgi:hypothetical protein
MRGKTPNAAGLSVNAANRRPYGEAFSPPICIKCVSARVMAIQVRRLQDAEDGFQHLVKSDLWEVVLPELIFAPEMSNPRHVPWDMRTERESA